MKDHYRDQRIKIGFRTDATDEQLHFIRQMGATEVVTGRPAEDCGPVWNLAPLQKLKARIEGFGLSFSVVETMVVPDRVKLGLPGRDEDIENYCESIRNIGRAGVSVLAYNWMAGFSWLRTSVDKSVRGGALSTAYNQQDMQELPEHGLGEVSEEQLWESIEYFLKAAVPAAAEVGVKLALHPDDPPVSPVRGMTRIMVHPDSFQRVLDLVPSPFNGLTFCQGCFGEMGADIKAEISRFGKQNKIFFVHFRNLTGDLHNFTETFHDSGDIDMYSTMKAYYDIGFSGPMRPDHAPTMVGESNNNPGYGLLGRLLAVGYMNGLM
jgi:mannonate dehydratase